jgi:cytidylate kinase
MIIAIDGPAGSGKSTVAKLVARVLGFAYLDTGAMYRAVAVAAHDAGLDVQSEEQVAPIARERRIAFGYAPGDPLPSSVAIDGADVTAAIRTPLADRIVTPVSQFAQVREALVAQQRAIGRERDTVMEGRDIGTVVFPDAELKVFLVADPEVRAARRARQNAERFAGTSLEELHKVADEATTLADIQRRDREDSSRSVGPLKPAPDSIQLDSTSLSIEEVVERIVQLAAERINSELASKLASDPAATTPTPTSGR